MVMSSNSAVLMKNINKRFYNVEALKDVTFFANKGEVHALVGENGAGKSTLIKILGGVIQKDSGNIFINGDEVQIDNPQKGRSLGISIVHQERNIQPYLSIAENILLGKLIRKGGFINWKETRKKCQEILDRLGLKIDPLLPITTISIAEQRIIEIARALSFKSNIIVMDEPSAILDLDELKVLFEVIKNLRKNNITVIYISHRIEEIFKIADRVTVLKDGSVQGTFRIEDAYYKKIINLMIGRQISNFYYSDDDNSDKKNVKHEEIMKINKLTSNKYFKDVSFQIRSGEILGLAGMVGSGRSELAKAIIGRIPVTSGSISFKGRKILPKSPRHSKSIGIALVPEERASEGLVRCFSVLQNITLPILSTLSISGFILKNKERKIAKYFIKKLNIKTKSCNEKIMNLSGGNQQKVVLAKWLSTNCELLIIDEPTRGIDVGAKNEIYKILRLLVAEGKSILMISSELPEILGMCDRILVMRDGGIAGELSKKEATEEKVLILAAGKKEK